MVLGSRYDRKGGLSRRRKDAEGEPQTETMKRTKRREWVNRKAEVSPFLRFVSFTVEALDMDALGDMAPLREKGFRL